MHPRKETAAQMPGMRGSEHTIVYLKATPEAGRAFVFTCGARAGTERPATLCLPQVSTPQVEGWLTRRNEAGQALGGFQLVQHHSGTWLLREWVHRLEVVEQARVLASPFQEVIAAVPEAMETLRQALRWIVECWRAEADVLSGGEARQQEVAKRLRHRLVLPLGAILDEDILDCELRWFLYEAELERLLPQLSAVVMVPLREWLTDLGLADSRHPLTFLPLGQLGQLPLQMALVPDPRSGKQVPFQDTCRLTLIDEDAFRVDHRAWLS